ncbi:MAG: TatD family hydrolase [Bacteroidales bacterium]
MLIDIHTHRQTLRPDICAVLQIAPRDVSSCTGLFSIGIHPWDTGLDDCELEEYFDSMRSILNSSVHREQFFALGECGLDKLQGAPLDKQIYWFKKQVALSESASVPLIIHCVKAWDELLKIHKQTMPQMPWIIHGFRGKSQLARQLLAKNNIFLSFGVYFNTEALLATPSERLFIETDEMEADLSVLYYSVANERNISPNELISQIECNFVFLKK